MYVNTCYFEKPNKTLFKLFEKLRKKVDLCVSVGFVTDEKVFVKGEEILFNKSLLHNISFPYYCGILNFGGKIYFNTCTRICKKQVEFQEILDNIIKENN